MSAPDSEVFYFENDKITKVAYQETEHYKLTKMIMEDPGVIMKEL